MPGYISEISYSGGDASDFVELAIPTGTDVSGYSVVLYNSEGDLQKTWTLGSVVQTVGGNDVYVIDGGTTEFEHINPGDAVALIDDLGNVVQFVSFGNTVNAADGAAAGETSTNIGTTSGSDSLQSDNGGASYCVQTTTNKGTIPCYAPGTLIDTPNGPRAVKDLQVGDLVSTLDHGPLPIRWLRRGDQPLDGVAADARPVLIRAGAFGPGCPARDLIVSPQHRILVGGRGQLDDLTAAEAFAPAKALTTLPRIRAMRGKRAITWHHFALDCHAVITAQGCLSESLLLGPMVLNGLTSLQRRALEAAFGPAAKGEPLNGPPARDCLSVAAVRRLVEKAGATAAAGIAA